VVSARRSAILFIAVCILSAGVEARIKRSTAAKHEFQREQPCPATGRTNGKCPGYVIDHMKPLACGGDDKPRNMQWQTSSAAKAKDKWERKGCMTRKS
jgi:hypothetical protein